MRLRAQLAILEDVVKDYPGRTIENIIANIEARIKTIERHEKTQDKPRRTCVGDDCELLRKSPCPSGMPCCQCKESDCNLRQPCPEEHADNDLRAKHEYQLP